MKRIFDFVVALAGLAILSPLFVVIVIAIKLDSAGPVFFRQERVGKGFRPFVLYKFRTMVKNAPSLGGPLTAPTDPRITRVGRLLRRTKLDELPQLVNVLCGDMSLVGPRPEVPYYVDQFRADFEEVLQVRPGITDLASIKYRNEHELLATAPDPEELYRRQILPDKIRLAKEYIARSSFVFDLTVLVRTLASLFTFARKSSDVLDPRECR